MSPARKHIAIIGGGPAGLIAAETLSAHAHAQSLPWDVHVYERKPSLARKFLMAGRGGLNLTHSEDMAQFLARYGAAVDWLTPAVNAFAPAQLRQWCEDLGQQTFTGTSGRVFPKSMKASPLLRAWIDRLLSLDVKIHVSHEWLGWDDGALSMRGADGATLKVNADATLLALGGASWPRLGSDGSWVGVLEKQGVTAAPLRPSNGGFIVDWPENFASRHAGQPLKPLALTCGDMTVEGEAMITAQGIEGGAVYALSSRIRAEIDRLGHGVMMLDFKPQMTVEALTKKLAAPRKGLSFSNWLRRNAALAPPVIALLQSDPSVKMLGPAALAHKIKGFPVTAVATAPIDRAISTAGGITRATVDDAFMLSHLPGVFVAGEMLDWEAPTGGYLLQATFATGVAAARGMIDFLKTDVALKRLERKNDA